MRFYNLKAEVPEEKVLQKMNCPPESEWYEEFQSELEELESEAKRALAVLLLSKYPRGTRFIFLDRSSRMTLAIFSEEADIRYS